jgi:heme exporter protein CcmD
MDPVSHAGFIVAAYAAAFAVVGGLTAWVMVDYRAQLRSLADLDDLEAFALSAAETDELRARLLSNAERRRLYDATFNMNLWLILS